VAQLNQGHCNFSYGEGMLYEQMPAELRERDPLIETCRFAEAKDARYRGSGARYYFVMPLFGRASSQRKRIIRAACLLHDVSWRARPITTMKSSLTVTRANLVG
jgi:exopolyphosphatase/guanosine-5'-triphosphate,3'-diphosphate pyrophosphatase